MFLAQFWRLENSSRLFYDFSEILILQDPSVFSNWYLAFLILHYSPFQKNGILETIHNWFLVTGAGCKIEKDMEIRKISEKYCSCLYLSIDQVWLVNDLWFKRYVEKCTLPHVLILIMMSQIYMENQEIVKNAKTRICQKQNITFFETKKFLMWTSNGTFLEVIML